MYVIPKDAKTKANAAAKAGNQAEMYEWLGKLPLADYAQLMLHGTAGLAALHSAIPTWPDEKTQMTWVGDKGKPLLMRTANLARLFDNLSWQVRGTGLRGSRILDYGLGWGRLTRFMNYYAGPDMVHGVDPMQLSLDMCDKYKLPNEKFLIPTRPHSAGYSGLDGAYDFVYLFSVFSHTPEDVTKDVLTFLRGHISENGAVACTIRADDWLKAIESRWETALINKMKDAFEANGYAFVCPPSYVGPLDKADYGDTIVSPERFAAWVEPLGWRLSKLDRDVTEPFQLVAVLTPA